MCINNATIPLDEVCSSVTLRNLINDPGGHHDFLLDGRNQLNTRMQRHKNKVKHT